MENEIWKMVFILTSPLPFPLALVLPLSFFFGVDRLLLYSAPQFPRTTCLNERGDLTKTTLPLARKDQLVIREIPNETLVYDERRDKAYCLNHTASLVWKNCDGNREPADIARQLTKELSVNVPEAFVQLAIQQLNRDNLLENHDSSKKVIRIPRREVIRRIGLTTAIALPVVISLAIPTSATAASCACINPGGCAVQTLCPSTVNCNGDGVCAP